MPEFAYTARTLSGDDVTGTITAANKRETLRALADRSLFALHVEDKQPAPAGRWFRGRVKASLLAANFSQLADLLQNGVSLLHALDILAEQAANDRLAEVLTEVRDRVADGAALEEALSRHPDLFGELIVNMVRAGSEGAFLEEALRRVANFLERQEDLKNRVVGALSYPAFLGVAGCAVTFVLIVFFVPRFSELFTRLQRQGGGLPMPTVALLALSEVLGRYGLPLAGAAVVLGVWVRRRFRSDRGWLLWDRWKLKLPLFGQIFLGTALSRFCRVLGTLLRNGVPLLKALQISSDSAGNRVLADAIRQSAENVSSGNSLSRPLAQCGLIPRPVMAMIAVAEESNNLAEVLIHIAEGIDRKTARHLDVMVRLVEPVLLVVLGGVIAFVLVALLLPVFDLSAALG